MRPVPAGRRRGLRQDPNVTRSPGAGRPAAATAGVVIVLGGKAVPAGGQTCTPSSSTSYAVVLPGVRPVTGTRA